MDRALLLVSNRLDRVGGYPDEADQPFVATAGGGLDTAVARMILTRDEGNDTPIHHYGEFVEDVVIERFRRIDGIGDAGLFGGTEYQMQVVVDPDQLARYQLTVSQLLNALQANNASLTAGNVDEGKRSYVIRLDSEFDSIDQISSILLRSEEDPETGAVSRLTLADVADVGFSYTERGAYIRYLGEEALALFLSREAGANVIEVLEEVRAALDELNAEILPRQGLSLRLTSDQTRYIDEAINLVLQNILLGGAMAAVLLLLFLRSARATLIISIAIPVSVIGTFVAMSLLGRSINVISLAGIAFAVGMVVDAAIVVLENIYRLRQQGHSAREAAARGAEQVWGAVLVSALTTVMVFIPLLLTDLEVGQLFRDIAVAISVSVVLSLLVAITVIPALSSRLLGRSAAAGTRGFPMPGIDHLARGFSWLMLRLASLLIRIRTVGLIIVLLVGSGAGYLAWAFLPQLDYLPEGNQNFIAGRLIAPPGYNLETMDGVAREIEAQVEHLFADPDDPDGGPPADGPPAIDAFFIVVSPSFGFMGVTAEEEERIGELLPVMQQSALTEPGTLAFFSRASVFGRGLGGTRTIDINVSGGELEQTLRVAQEVAARLGQVFPPMEGHQFRPVPGLELGAPEVRLIPDPSRLSDTGVTARDLGLTIDTFNDGFRIAEISIGGQRMNLILRGPEGMIDRTQGIGDLPVVTPSGAVLPVDSLARITNTAGPTSIRRVERQRTITLILFPAEGIPLEAAIERVEDEVLDPIREAGLPPGMTFDVSGTADELSRTWDAMVWDLLLALVIVYLVMAVLFESLFYPLIILISVPIAAAGGVGGLALLNLYVPQTLDMLTLLGFVILTGIVVNNAILLVHQALLHYRSEGLALQAAIMEATRNRIRPIFMSSLTSIFGMLPLVLFPGAGSELYRGLGSVVLGGLSLSAVLTLIVVPPLLSIFMGVIEGAKARFLARSSGSDEAEAPAE
jgi:HAE1 family hydrophobic/amphiphilic exporter-1